MSWCESIAAALTRQQRHNLRSWGVDAPEPQTIEEAHIEALGHDHDARLRYSEEKRALQRALETALGPCNVWTGKHRHEGA